jgi:predicted nucleotidyltransferase
LNTDFLTTLPDPISRTLSGFIESAREAFGDDLRSVVLYGSAAEGHLRPSSDINLLVLLASFDRDKADKIRNPLRVARAAAGLKAMFLLEQELRPASEAFAVKFSGLLRSRRVLYGIDPFVDLTIAREAMIRRLKQTLLNLLLRLREAYVARGLREEQLAAVIADSAGPLRSCAATLLESEGSTVESPKAAFEKVAAQLASGSDWTALMSVVSESRQNKALPPGVAAATLFNLIELTRLMWLRAEALS